MKKLIVAAAVIAMAAGANAQSRKANLPEFFVNQKETYNRAAVSYNYTNVSDIDGSCGLNGVGLNFIHGLKVWNNIFGELGGSFAYQSGSNNTNKYSLTSFQLPVNAVYRLGEIAEGVSLDPYTGVNLKLNMLNSTYSSTFQGPGTAVTTINSKNSYFRFQPDLHAGIGLYYSQLYLGIEVGVDLFPLYKEGENTYNTTNFKLSLGYTL